MANTGENFMLNTYKKMLVNCEKTKSILDVYKGKKHFDELMQWWYEEYLKHFPKPTRKENIWKNEEVLPYGYTIYKQEKYTNTVSMTKEEFVRFIVTQSNVIAKVEQGDLSEKETMDWFRRTLKPVFQEKIHKLVFEGYNWYLINHKNKYE